MADEDPDSNLELDWSTAKLLLPEPKTSVHLRLDPDMLAWFRSQGRGYQTRMNAVLRSYYLAKIAVKPPRVPSAERITGLEKFRSGIPDLAADKKRQ